MAAWASRRRFRRSSSTPAVAWLFSIAQHKLADYHRRGAAEDRMRKRLGIQRVALGEEDRELISVLGRDAGPWKLIDVLPTNQRDAVRAHVLDDQGLRGDRHRPTRNVGGGGAAQAVSRVLAGRCGSGAEGGDERPIRDQPARR